MVDSESIDALVQKAGGDTVGFGAPNHEIEIDFLAGIKGAGNLLALHGRRIGRTETGLVGSDIGSSKQARGRVLDVSIADTGAESAMADHGRATVVAKDTSLRNFVGFRYGSTLGAVSYIADADL